ncbi:STAS domain-containing protein [Streptomyces sp. NPDC006172]|uniref:STAS domain-containing protein n=1 Tax=Streptomyces sp. NPDC006172 TaxID=3154470 RepID=UPI0033F142A9
MITERLRATTAFREGDAHVAVAGEIDYDNAAEFRAALASCLIDGPKCVRLDLARVQFCDCAGLNVLLEARGHAIRAGASLAVDRVSPAVGRLFQLTRTAPLFQPSTQPR